MLQISVPYSLGSDSRSLVRCDSDGVSLRFADHLISCTIWRPIKLVTIGGGAVSVLRSSVGCSEPAPQLPTYVENPSQPVWALWCSR